MISSKLAVGIFIGLLGCPSWGMAASCIQDPDYEYARQLRDQKYYVEAKPVLQTVVARDPGCMEGKMELALVYFSLQEYDQAEALLLELRSAADSIPDLAAAATVRQTIDDHLEKIPQLREEMVLNTFSPPQLQQEPHKAPLQVALGVGGGNNINGGVHFNELTFDVGGLPLTTKLGEESKAQSGSFLDVEGAYQYDLPASTGMDGSLRLAAAMRDNHRGDDYDLGTLRGGLELKPAAIAASVQPSVVLSAGSFFLGGDHYRQDIALGVQALPFVFDRNLKLSYQLTDSYYKTVADVDSRFHKINLSVPLTSGNSVQKFGVGLDLSYQWPESSERLADYRETSARLRLLMEPIPKHTVSASYGFSQQQDAAAYNTLAFGDKKRNLEQQVLDIGWSWKGGRHMAYEANLLTRNTDSSVKLFENSSVEFAAGVRWELE